MPDESPQASATPDPIERGIQWITSSLGACRDQQQIILTVEAALQHYGPEVTTLILHESGRKFLEMQQQISFAIRNWYSAIGVVGHNTSTLPAAAARIYAAHQNDDHRTA